MIFARLSSIAKYLLLLFAIVIITVVVVTDYLLLNINHYKSYIFRYADRLGYRVTVDYIDTRLSSWYMPQVDIHDITISSLYNSKQNLHIAHLRFVLNYSSLLYLQPVFYDIVVERPRIRLEQLADGRLMLNGMVIGGSVNSKFDLEQWLLRNNNVRINNADFVFVSSKLALPIFLHNLNIALHDDFLSNYHYIKLINSGYYITLHADLSWVGKNLHFDQANELSLLAHTIDNNLMINSLDYMSSSVFDIMKVTSTLQVAMQHGRLYNFYTDFDFRDLVYLDFVIPQASGKISVNLANDDSYRISFTDLTVRVNQTYMMHQESALGAWSNESGHVVTHGAILLNNTLNIIPDLHDVNVKGAISNIKFKWQGYLAPKAYDLSLGIKDIAIVSHNQDIPSIDNVNGLIGISSNEQHTAIDVNLLLNNSIFDYKKVFLIPIFFQPTSVQLMCDVSSDNMINLQIYPSKINTSDFAGNIFGSYLYDPHAHNNGYLNLYASIIKAPANRVAFYLPRQIGSVHNWLDVALVNGYGMNGTMIFSGILDDFPFKSGNGKFHVDADLSNVSLHYADNWPLIENIYGKFQLRNQKILISTKSATCMQTNIESAIAIIPDITAGVASYLSVDGIATGNTQYFLNFLKNSPLDNLLDNIASNASADGVGKMNIALHIPLEHPDSLKLNGDYDFKDNDILFARWMVPELTHVNGRLFFYESGVYTPDIHMLLLNANTQLVSPRSDGVLLKLSSKQIDYQDIAALYAPYLSKVFTGHADLNSNISVNHHHVRVDFDSDLQNVLINLPPPLKKHAHESGNLHITVLPTQDHVNIDFNYNNKLVTGSTSFDRDKLRYGYIVVDQLHNAKPMHRYMKSDLLIGIRLNDIHILDYLSSLSSSHVDHQAYNMTAEVILSTDNLYLGGINLHSADGDVLIDNNAAIFVLYSAITNGYGIYNLNHNLLTLNLNTYYFYSKADGYMEDTYNDKSIESAMQIPNIDFKLKNLYYENNNMGSMEFNIRNIGSSIVLESGLLIGSAESAVFHGITNCVNCVNDSTITYFDIHADIKNLGMLLYKLEYNNIIKDGSGKLDAHVMWLGKLTDFNYSRIVGDIKLHFMAGSFEKVDTGSVLGSLIAIFSLQALTRLLTLDFSGAVANGFYFDDFILDAHMNHGVLEIKRSLIDGPIALVNCVGLVNIGKDELDLYLAVKPKVSGVFAFGVAAANPLLGAIVYAADWLLGRPFNKLFAFSYHLTGTLEHIKAERIKFSSQIYNNLGDVIFIR